MRVQRVLSPGGVESWTVVGSHLRPVEPLERYLAWLSRIERAPTTVRAYAHDLKTFWEFVASRGIEWDSVSLEQLGEFTAWLRSPAENVVVLASGRPARSPATVNRMLTAVFGFYEFHARHGVPVARALVDERRAGRGAFKPFLHGIAPSRPRGRVGRLREESRLPAAWPPCPAAGRIVRRAGSSCCASAFAWSSRSRSTCPSRAIRCCSARRARWRAATPVGCSAPPGSAATSARRTR